MIAEKAAQIIINMYRGDFTYKETSLTESSVPRHSKTALSIVLILVNESNH
jgi:hypothetical protein